MTDPIDPQAYLERVGVRRDEVRAPTVAALRRLHRAHVDALPFATVHTALGRVPALDLPTVARRLVVEDRGGYCLEHVALFTAVLEALGFRPQVRLHHVGPLDAEVAPSPTHLTVLARPADDDRRWLADVGFGVGILGPVPLPGARRPGPGDPVRHGAWEHRAEREADGRVVLRERREDAWVVLHHGPDRSPSPTAIADANRWVARDPRSPFAGRLVAMRTTGDRRERLIGTRLEVAPAGAPARTTELGPEEAVAELGSRFGVATDPGERTALVAALAERSAAAAARP